MRTRARRYFVVAKNTGRRQPLRATTIDDAVAEAKELEAATVGQVIDVWQYGRRRPVAVSIDEEG